MKKCRIVIMISGNGSNMEALIKATHNPDFPAEIIGVISDKRQAGGVIKAQNLGVATFICERKDFASQAVHEAAQLAILTRLDPDLVCLAGYMRLMSAEMVDLWAGRMLNIHPSLLPLFPGLDTHRRALESGMKIAGCTVHLVTPVMDSGPILAQAAVPIMQDDDEESLKKRVLAAEHRLYITALQQFILNPGGIRQQNEEEVEFFSYGSYATTNRR